MPCGAMKSTNQDKRVEFHIRTLNWTCACCTKHAALCIKNIYQLSMIGVPPLCKNWFLLLRTSERIKKQKDAASHRQLHNQRHWTYLFGVSVLFPLLWPLCGCLDWGLVAREPWHQNSALGIDNWGFYLKWGTRQKRLSCLQKCTVIDKYDLENMSRIH